MKKTQAHSTCGIYDFACKRLQKINDQCLNYLPTAAAKVKQTYTETKQKLTKDCFDDGLKKKSESEHVVHRCPSEKRLKTIPKERAKK